MKLFKLGLILTAVMFFIIACAQQQTTNTNVANNTENINSNSVAPPSSPPDELASAREIYSQKCIKCHKEDGTGGVTQLEDRKVKAPNFTSDKMKNEPDSEYIEVIENGEKEDGMPAFKGKLSDDDIKNLVKYIRKEFQGK